MCTLNAIGLRLVAVGMLLAPLAAQGKLYLEGPETWYRNQTITVRLVADADTSVRTLAFGTDETLAEVYDKFASVLVLQPALSMVPDFIKTGLGDCNADDSACSFAYWDEPLSIKEGTVVTWVFWVRDDAPLGLVSFDFDLKAEADTDFDFLPEPIGWLEPKQFLVAIPESSTWVLMVFGLVAVGARAYRRRMGD
jgi:hypothetical protein